MSKSRKLKVASTAVGSLLAVMGLAALPAASAVQCSVPVQLLTGTVENLQVPQGYRCRPCSCRAAPRSSVRSRPAAARHEDYADYHEHHPDDDKHDADDHHHDADDHHHDADEHHHADDHHHDADADDDDHYDAVKEAA